jgi:hypothetical protein
MGSLYLFGIPIYEDADAADSRRNDRTKRKKIEEESDVEKKIAAEKSEQVRANTGTNLGGTVKGVAENSPLSQLAGGVGEGLASGNLQVDTPWGSIGGGAPAPAFNPLYVVGAILALGVLYVAVKR